MNVIQGGIGGVQFAPVARKSIHCHEGYCPFACGELTMNQTRSTSVIRHNFTNMEDNERDEVDNIISKHAYPIGFQRQLRRRRSQSSIDHLTDNDIYDGESQILSTSLPTYFPPHLNFSTDYDMEDREMFKNLSGISSDTTRSRSRFDESDMETSSRSLNNHQQESSGIFIPIIGGVCALIVIMIAVQFSLWDIYKYEIFPPSLRYDKIHFNRDIYNLGEKYNLNEDSILQLQTGISSISEKEDTDSFIFVYNSKSQRFNSNTFNDFINEVATVAARFLRNESSTVRHIIVDTSSLPMRDSSELINKYRDEIAKGGVMVMTRIDALPSSLAMALHYYCDEYNPLAKKTAIFFTLDLGNCSDQRTTHALIEKCLASKWKSISPANIGPLLSRVVSVLIDVTTVF